MWIVFSSTAIVVSSATVFMSTSTGGATMPRLMFTSRSVPPPIGRLSGCAARAGLAAAAVGLRAAALLDRRKHPVGGDRQIVEADADGVGDRVGQRRQEGRERALAGFLGAERAVRIDALDDADLDRWRVENGRDAVVEH